MSHETIKTILTTCLFIVLAGCASMPPATSEYQHVDRTADSRTKKVLLTIGTILAVGVIVLHEAEDGAKDSLRRVSLP